MKKTYRYFLKITSYTFITAIVGTLSHGFAGLLISPSSFWIFNKFSKKNKWEVWFSSGVIFSIFFLANRPWFDIPYKHNPGYGPQNPTAKEDSRVTDIKLRLVNGIKKCIVREADGLSTKILDIESFKRKDIIFEIKSNQSFDLPDSCFSVESKQYEFKYFDFFDSLDPIPPLKKIPTFPVFKIHYSPETGIMKKTCNNLNDFDGCSEENTW